MNRLMKSARNLRIRAQLSAPMSIRRPVEPHLSDFKEIGRLIAMPYLPVYELSGQGRDGPLTVTFVNVLPSIKGTWTSLLFEEQPVERIADRIPFWRWDEVADRTSGDLAFVGGSRSMIRRLPTSQSVVVPVAVDHTLNLSGDWSEVEGRIHQRLLKSHQRQARKHGYQFDVSHDERDFDEFYRQMYQPTTRTRHGEDSQPMARYEAREYFRRGYLFQVTRDGSWVAGAIRDPEGSTLIGRILGVRDADPEEIRNGVIPALYYAGIRWAYDNGYRAMDFLESGPLLDLGLYQFKRRWGTTISPSPRLRRRLWVKVRRDTAAVAGFLKDNPLIVQDADDRLHGLIVVDDPAGVSDEARRDWEKRYLAPGLEGLKIRAVSSFFQPERGAHVQPISATDGGRSGAW